MPSLTLGRASPACCAVRWRVVVLGGFVEAEEEEENDEAYENTASVEILGYASQAGTEFFKVMPPLSCGPIYGSNAVVIDESESEQGQVLLIGGYDEDDEPPASAVHMVDLATGLCTPQPSLIVSHGRLEGCTAARLPDGRIVCVGANYEHGPTLVGTAQVMEPPNDGSSSWLWRYLPDTSAGRDGGGGCVLSDGRFAVFEGLDTASCEVLTLDGDGTRWDPLLPMHEARHSLACAAIGGCVIVAGGVNLRTVEVYEEALGTTAKPTAETTAKPTAETTLFHPRVLRVRGLRR
jgi:hypothetical protein